MARLRRNRKPLLPGLWTVMAACALIGSVGGMFWMLGMKTKISRANPTSPNQVGVVAKGK